VTLEQARAIVANLARGIDPCSGELLADDSAVSSPQVIRALFIAVRALEARVEASTGWREAQVPRSQAGKAWSVEEDQRLIAAFDEGLAIAALAGEHERSHGAIRSRLMRLGRWMAE